MYVLNNEQEKWLQALESGKYKQGKGFLNAEGCFCCLGVACEILEVPKAVSTFGGILYQGKSATVPDSVVWLLKLNNNHGGVIGHKLVKSLVHANDTLDYSFDQIASFIRANPEKVFRPNGVEHE